MSVAEQMQYDYSILRKSYRDNYNDEIRVAIYGRVSTLHEEQIAAFGRQLEWYEQVLASHPNWKVINTYEDKTSGTTSERKGFQQMIADAKNGDFDLIITREVCRFARNTVDSLHYTRLLKEYNVEIYFVSDNIWSMDTDGELRLTIFSALAQDESRKVSERVYHGQMICRKNGVIFGSGNILGYDLVKGATSVENNYVINEEQAETVRRIFELYLQGEGMKQIALRMEAEGRKCATGQVKWHPSKISRIIANKTYCGYIVYNKSKTADFLSHKRIINNDRSTYEYVKGRFEPIVSEEVWEAAQEIAKSKTYRTKDNKLQCKNVSKDKWTRKLLCSCGRTFRKYEWRTNKNGETSYGYVCRNQVGSYRKSYRELHGVDTQDSCDIPSICEWKLDFMFCTIFHELFDAPGNTLSKLSTLIKRYYEYIPDNSKNQELDKCKIDLSLTDSRLKELTLKYLDGKITDEIYSDMKGEFQTKYDNLSIKIKELEKEIEEDNQKRDIAEIKATQIEAIRSTLFDYIDFTDSSCNALVNRFVTRVTPCDNHIYKWYINLNSNLFTAFNEEDYELYDFFTVGFSQAKEYRKERGHYIRQNQWHDLKLEIYVNI